jgi:hypothetical protein
MLPIKSFFHQHRNVERVPLGLPIYNISPHSLLNKGYETNYGAIGEYLEGTFLGAHCISHFLKTINLIINL